ncbi:PIN domain nuclease [bacterium]|nr:PIN domain nuclease [bacterium]
MVREKHLVLVDTSAWICFFARRGFSDIKQSMTTLLQNDLIAITGPIFLELIQGTRSEKERKETESRLQALHWLSIDDAHWDQAAQLAFRLRRKGITVSAIDAIIAVVALDHSCMLLHCDTDFNMIAEHSELRIFASGMTRQK